MQGGDNSSILPLGHNSYYPASGLIPLDPISLPPLGQQQQTITNRHHPNPSPISQQLRVLISNDAHYAFLLLPATMTLEHEPRPHYLHTTHYQLSTILHLYLPNTINTTSRTHEIQYGPILDLLQTIKCSCSLTKKTIPQSTPVKQVTTPRVDSLFHLKNK